MSTESKLPPTSQRSSGRRFEYATYGSYTLGFLGTVALMTAEQLAGLQIPHGVDAVPAFLGIIGGITLGTIGYQRSLRRS